MKSVMVVFCTALLVLTASEACADVIWNWTWSGGDHTGAGTLTTDNLSAGSYLITAATGSWDGISIVGLGPVNTCCGLGGPFDDNLLLVGPPQLDLSGVSFAVAGDEINLFYDTYFSPNSYYLLDQTNTYSPGGVVVDGEFNAALVTAAVPEPASLALFAPALIGLGFLIRAKRNGS